VSPRAPHRHRLDHPGFILGFANRLDQNLLPGSDKRPVLAP